MINYVDSEEEVYLRMLNKFKGMTCDYELKFEKHVGVKGVYFQRVLDGDVLDTFNKISLNDLEEYIVDEDLFKSHVYQLTNSILGSGAYDKQLEYLRNTKKPQEMT